MMKQDYMLCHDMATGTRMWDMLGHEITNINMGFYSMTILFDICCFTLSKVVMIQFHAYVWCYGKYVDA